MRISWTTLTLAIGVCLTSVLLVVAQTPGRKAANRAKLPTFDPAQTNRVFFPDVFARLEGERPANPNAAVVSSGSAAMPAASASAASDGGGGYAWSKIISATTLEDEVKAIKLASDKNITTPQDFAGRGYKEIRRDFSVLAMLFAVINEYDTDVRWKKDSQAAREIFARTASNAKAGNNNVYNEAKKRKDELADLINGSAPAVTVEQPDNDWSKIADRSPLMQRLQIAGEANLAPWTSSAQAFSENVEKVMHEAEIIAAISEVLTREGMADGEDETYAEFAKLMKTNALEVVAAVKSNNADQARQAMGEINKACSDCHDSYR